MLQELKHGMNLSAKYVWIPSLTRHLRIYSPLIIRCYFQNGILQFFFQTNILFLTGFWKSIRVWTFMVMRQINMTLEFSTKMKWFLKVWQTISQIPVHEKWISFFKFLQIIFIGEGDSQLKAEKNVSDCVGLASILQPSSSPIIFCMFWTFPGLSEPFERKILGRAKERKVPTGIRWL